MQVFGVHLRALRVALGYRGHLQGVDPLPQPRRHHLPDSGQRPQRALLDSGDAGRRGLQRDGDGDRLLVVEQQRRQVGAGVQPVAAVRALGGPTGIAELAQPVDVPAHGPRADLQPLGERVAGPVTPGLQQRQQPQQPPRCAWDLCHAFQNARSSGQKLAASPVKSRLYRRKPQRLPGPSISTEENP